MENDLLISLRKYRPRETRNPSENFVTEAFAWLLKTNPSFSKHYIDYICTKVNFHIDTKVAKWETQVNFGGYFPDLICEASGKALIFEHKLFSHLHANQLQNYKDYASNKYDDYKLILLTANTTQHKQNPDLPLCWEDIHKLIEDWIKGNENSTNLLIFYNFLRLLEFEGLGPKAPISHESILYFFRGNHFLRNVINLMKDISQSNYDDFQHLIPEKDYALTLRNQWGRTGLELHNSWTPCLFTGIISDTEGHKVDSILGLDSPDVVVMLCFDSPLHNLYEIDTDYLLFVEELRQKSKGLTDDWEVHFHFEDDTKVDKNKWHPIYIRKPFVKMMAGTKDFAEQKEIFINSVKEIIPYFTNSKHFQNMKKRWATPS